MKSIKQKLLVFVCLICGTLICMVMLFARFGLEPTYTAMVKSDLNKEMDTIVSIIGQKGLMDEDGTAFQEEASRAIAAEMTDGQCFEVSSLVTGTYVGGLDRIANCALHTERNDTVWGEMRSVNNMLVVQLRATVAEQQRLDLEVSGVNGDKQYVVGRLIPEENIIVLLSASMERIGQAADIIQRQLGVGSLILLAISVLLAFFFAGWFTKPLSALSDAAREMAKGNYTIQLPVTQKDEIGVLTQDFNTMAREVSRADALQKDIIANVSHDLRTPLTLIKGYAETIRDLNGDDVEKRNAQLNIIISESDRLSALVGSVMELSRLNAGTEKFEPVTFDLSDFCEELSYRYEDTCRKNGYTLQLCTPGERLITADPELMSRVLHNLLANAIAHIGADGVVLLRVQDTPDGGLLVEVEDHGSGIAKDELNHIFERYYRARQANGRPGTGLGLSIVRAILVTHKYPFGVRSTEGQGSTFWFKIPVSSLPKAPEPPAHAKKSLPAKTEDSSPKGPQ